MIERMARRFGSPHASAKDLVAYADGYIAGQRRDLVEEHLRVCARCRECLRAFDEVDRIVRTGAPLVDDPAGRAALHARLAAGGPRAATSARRPPAKLLAVASSLVLLLALLAWPLASEADFPLGSFIRFGPVRGDRFPDVEVPPLVGVSTEPASTPRLAFPAVAPERLPLGLKQVERATPDEHRLEVLYRGQGGLAVLLTESLAGSDVIEVESFGARDVVSVSGTEVLWLKDPWPGSVGALLWEREGVRFELRVTKAPSGGMALAGGAEIVEALAAAQDVAE